MGLGKLGEGHGVGHELLLEHRVLSEFECDKVEAGEGCEAPMKGFARKASISEMVSLGEGREKAVGVKVFLVEDCREEVLVIKDEVGSVDGFGGEAQERRLIDVRIWLGRGTRFEVEGV